MGSLLGAFPDGCSPFRGIRSLKPGHFLVADRRGVGAEMPYWQPDFRVDSKMTFEDAKERTRELFKAAVKRRMVADVPVGTYLSGGLDSSLVCALMSEQARGQPFKAFNVGFGDPRYDESALARKIAGHFGAEFETIPCSEAAMADEYEKTLYHVEMPLVNPSAIAKQMLSRLVRSQGYKVCITGEGSDEIFGGYPYFKQEAIWRALLDPESYPEVNPEELWERFTREEKHTEGALWSRGETWRNEDHWFGYPSFHQMRLKLSDRKTARIMSRDVVRSTTRRVPSEFFLNNFDRRKMRSIDPFNATKMVAFSQIANYIIPTLGDRVEMANSVECRTPFLDRDLVDFACTVPPKYFLNLPELREKYLLRQAFEGTLPEFLHKERKKPFLGASWKTFTATKRGRELYGDFCSRAAIHRTGYFRASTVPQLKLLWKILPERSALWKKVDILMGLILGTQCLHEQFVLGRVRASEFFEIEDRTPGVARDKAAGLRTGLTLPLPAEAQADSLSLS
jgi:asparagine synthase (glutamine-hydrolysing)